MATDTVAGTAGASPIVAKDLQGGLARRSWRESGGRSAPPQVTPAAGSCPGTTRRSRWQPAAACRAHGAAANGNRRSRQDHRRSRGWLGGVIAQQMAPAAGSYQGARRRSWWQSPERGAPPQMAPAAGSPRAQGAAADGSRRRPPARRAP